MALWQLDEFQGATFLGYVRGVPAPEGFAGTKWLPNLTTDDLAFEYLKGTQNRTVMAHVMGFDSEAPIAGRPGLGEAVQGELPPIKRKTRISEKEIIRFLQPRAGTADKQRAINSVYDDTDRLLAAVQARVEWLRMQALSEDTVVYDEGGVIFEFDYGLNDALQWDATTGTDDAGATITGATGVAWTDIANANPFADLEAWLAAYEAETGGQRPAEMVLSRQAVSLMLGSVQLRELIRGPGALGTLTRAEVQTLLDQHEMPTLTTYDVTVSSEDDDGSLTDVRPMAANKAFFTPAGAVGQTLWGPTAESRVLIGTPLASQAPGIIAVTYDTQEPPAEWIKAAAVAFPTMPDAHLLAQATLF